MTFIAWLKGLSLFGKFAGAVGGLGGVFTLAWLGPAAPYVLIVFQAIGAVIRWLWQGFEVCVTHPVAWAVVAIGFFVGVHYGKQWDAHLVQKANMHIVRLEAQIRSANNADKARAELAIKARDAAKELQALSIPAVAGEPANIAVAQPKPTGVRTATGSHRKAEPCTSLFCF